MVKGIKEDVVSEREYGFFKIFEGFFCKKIVFIILEGWRELVKRVVL